MGLVARSREAALVCLGSSGACLNIRPDDAGCRFKKEPVCAGEGGGIVAVDVYLTDDLAVGVDGDDDLGFGVDGTG